MTTYLSVDLKIQGVVGKNPTPGLENARYLV
jgi:hypothetical protein